MHHPVKEFLGGEPARRLQAPQHIELCAASDRTECVGRAGCYRSPNDLWVVGDQLHHNRPAGRVSEHVHGLAEVLCQCGGMDGSDLWPGDIEKCSRMAAELGALREGVFAGGLPYLALGHGEPLIYLPGGASNHHNPPPGFNAGSGG